MNDHPALLHNMSAPPKSLVKYEGLSDFVIRHLPGGSGVTSVGYKPCTPGGTPRQFGTAVRFSLPPEFAALTVEALLEILDAGATQPAGRDPTAHLRALINARASAMPLPDGCAVIPAEKTHTVLWDDPLSALAILCKCADTVWLRSKNPSLIAIQQRSAVSLLVPPTFASRLPEKA
jgi:hypothetical protein